MLIFAQVIPQLSAKRGITHAVTPTQMSVMKSIIFHKLPNVPLSYLTLHCILVYNTLNY